MLSPALNVRAPKTQGSQRADPEPGLFRGHGLAGGCYNSLHTEHSGLLVAIADPATPVHSSRSRSSTPTPAAVTSTSAPSSPQTSGKQNLSAFIWSVADLLRGDYKQSDYGKVILPFTVLRRLDCVLEPSKAAVLEEKALREGQGLDPEPFLLRKTGHNFCNLISCCGALGKSMANGI